MTIDNFCYMTMWYRIICREHEPRGSVGLAFAGARAIHSPILDTKPILSMDLVRFYERCVWENRERGQTAFVTNPERRQRVQTRMRLWAPPMIARTVCRLGLKTRRVLLLA